MTGRVAKGLAGDAMQVKNLSALSTRDILRLYGGILDELLRREVIRTRNAPVGDYAETLVAHAYAGILEPNSNKSWDVTTPEGKRLQVKARVVGPTTRMSAKFSTFRSYGFDAAVFVVFDQSTYEVVRAVEVPAASVEERARYSEHVAGASISLGTDLMTLPGARDVTVLVRAAAEDSHREAPREVVAQAAGASLNPDS